MAEAPRLPGTGVLHYQPQTGEACVEERVFAIRPRSSFHTAEVRPKDDNYRTPADALEAVVGGSTELPDRDNDYRDGENGEIPEEEEWIAQVRQQALDWQRQTYIAESDCIGLAPGQRFSLIHHSDPRLNGDYFIVQVEHQANRDTDPDGNQSLHYHNKLELIRVGVPYRHPLEWLPG